MKPDLDKSKYIRILVYPLYLYKTMANQIPDDFYRIGSVAALTGIAVERLRAWERRHGFSPAHKNGRTRFYSADQLEKLKTIKHLIDRGQTVSSVINLSESQLHQRLTDQPAPTIRPSALTADAFSPKIGLVGANLLQLEQRQDSSGHLNIVARWANLNALLDPGQQQEQPDVLVLQVPVLSSQEIAKAQQALPGCKIISAYQFATAAELSRCQGQDAPILKWPLDWREIEYTCLEESKRYLKSMGYAHRRFSDEELIALSVGDDDPNRPTQHLVEAIHQVNALAAFLQSCAEENSGGAESDTGKSAALSGACGDAAYARAYLETALQAVSASASAGDTSQPTAASNNAGLTH